MKLKLDDKGNVVTVEKNGVKYPVYVDAEGKDVEFDAPHAATTIARLNKESQGHRERAEKAEGSLQKYEGLDPEKAREALKTVSNLNDKKLVEAGEVQKVKDEAIKATEQKFEPVVKERDTLRGALHGEMIGGRFARSKFISDKLAIPVDFAQARFGQQFKIEDGKVVAYHASGEKIFSRARPGDLADFDEALEIIVDGYPAKDSILKSKSKGGSGGGSNNSGGDANQKTILRKDFEKLSPQEAMAKTKEGVRIVDEL